MTTSPRHPRILLRRRRPSIATALTYHSYPKSNTYHTLREIRICPLSFIMPKLAVSGIYTLTVKPLKDLTRLLI